MTTLPVVPDYRKSSFSGTNSSCVEVRRDLESVRDTKNREAGDMPVSHAAFSAFVAAISDGRFRPTA